MLHDYYGKLNSANTIQNIVPLEESGKLLPPESASHLCTGDMHAAFYDYGNNKMFVSVAQHDPTTKGKQRIEHQFSFHASYHACLRKPVV